MTLLKIIKNNLFIQNFVTRLVLLNPIYLELGLAKYKSVKKALLITANDGTSGSYLEFGVMTGNSFNFAMKINKRMEKLFKKKLDIEFIGFDSFAGFGKINKEDENPTFKNEFFKINEKKVIKNIEKNARGQNYRLIKGFYKDTLEGKTTSDLNIKKSSIILIDCDLKESTKIALEFSKPSLQQGTIIVFDDFNYYKGDTEKGEYGAFEEFKKNIQTLDLEEFSITVTVEEHLLFQKLIRLINQTSCHFCSPNVGIFYNLKNLDLKNKYLNKRLNEVKKKEDS